MSGIIQYVTIQGWLFSLSIIPFSSIHVFACINVLFHC